LNNDGDDIMMSDRFPRYSFEDVTFDNQSFFILKGTFSIGDAIDYERSRHFFRNKTFTKHGKKPFFITEIKSHVVYRPIQIAISSYESPQLHFPARNTSLKRSSFDGPLYVQGSISDGKSIKRAIHGLYFVFSGYSQEERIFGVITGFAFCSDFNRGGNCVHGRWLRLTL
jgi:hypothetical protein